MVTMATPPSSEIMPKSEDMGGIGEKNIGGHWG